jgi:hypothetical protein
MAFTQSEIDTIGLWEELHNNPDGGNGADYTASCTILEDKNNTGYPLLWQSGDDETEEGFEKHQIGVTYAPDERFAYIVCTEKTNYSLTPGTFSEVSDEIIVHRVFCAALRPTDADFIFTNPIKDITVSASTDTVNLQVIALDEYKTVAATNPITVTHAQDFPCVFGIIYKHKAKVRWQNLFRHRRHRRRPLSSRRFYSIRFLFQLPMKLIMSSEHLMLAGVFFRHLVF